jgi:hypothetical protein
MGLRELGRRFPGPWWVLAACALILGLSETQDGIRGLGDASGLGVVGYLALTFIGISALVLLGGSAAVKWSDKRRAGRRPAGT